jgi:hypothetical protein
MSRKQEIAGTLHELMVFLGSDKIKEMTLWVNQIEGTEDFKERELLSYKFSNHIEKEIDNLSALYKKILDID